LLTERDIENFPRAIFETNGSLNAV